ncbi:MAG TPA: ABC transporter substrate-binding protein [Arenicellales bacterium]|nr:ABC transporter substrate-binding protein [Arenicellales bacterium]
MSALTSGGGGYRRRLLLTVAVLCVLAASAAAAADDCAPAAGSGETPRLAAINWGLTQTLVALGIEPVAVADAPGYRKWVSAPPLPASSVDIGRRVEPNLAVLAGTGPDLVLMSSFYDELAHELGQIVPVLTLDIYQPGGMPLVRARDVAACLARRFHREAALERLEQRLADAVDALAAVAREQHLDRPVYVVQFRDAGHLRVYGDNSLFGGVLQEAGLANAWRGATNFWGFSTTAFTELTGPAGLLIIVGPVPREAVAMMSDSPIWRALPAAASGRVARIDPVWAYGGVPSAIRFAGQLEAVLREPG